MSTPLREVFARFGIEVDDAKLKHAHESVNEFAEKLEKVGELLAGGLVVRELGEFVKGLAEQGGAIVDNARRLGVSTDAYQALGYAAKQSGGSVEALSTALLIAQDKLVDASKGSKEAAKAFSDLGIKTKDPRGQLRETEAILLDAAEAISKMESPAKQTSAAVGLFGRQGRELLPFLKEGRTGIQELTKEFGELGGGYDEVAAESGKHFEDALDRQKAAITSLRGRIATALLPILQKVVDGVTAGIAWFVRLSKETYLVQTALGVLGLALAGFAIKVAIAMAPALAPFVAMGALIGAIILIAEDLIVWFKGGKSAFGELLTAILGAEKAKAVLESVREAVKAISQWVGQTARDFRDFLRWVDEALSKLQALIGLRNAALAKGTTEDDRRAIRRQAVASGQTVRFPEESPEQARAANAGARTELAAARAIQGGAQAAGAAVANTLTQVFNTGNGMDEEKLARLARREAEGALTDANRAAAQALTREAPKK